MHFIGTLAYKPIHLMNLDPMFVWGSLFLAIAGSYFALAHIRRVEKKSRFLISSLIMMGSIGAMHMVGMQTFHENVMTHYRLPYVIVSILLMFIGSYFSFRWVDQMNHSNGNPLYCKLKGALAMGVGVLGFHYILMFDVSMSPIQHDLEMNTPLELSVDLTMLAIGVGFSTMLILLIVLIASYVEGKFSKQSLQLKTNEQYYQSLYSHNPDLVITYDIEGNFLSMNHIVESYGYTVEELIHLPFAPLIIPDQLQRTKENFHKAANGTATNYETAFNSKFGDRIEINVTLIPIIVGEEIVGVYGIHKDITSYKHAQEAKVEAELKFRSIVEESIVGIYIIQDGRFVYVNPKLLQMSGYTNEEIIGSTVAQHVYSDDWQLIKGNIQKRLKGEIKGFRYQYRAIKKDKSIMYLEVHASKTLYKGKNAVIGSVIDITEQKLAEEKIKHMAYHDALTGLPNRYQFSSCSQTVIQNQTMKTAAILFLDLDRFKLINDTLGHDIGDLLLKEVADRLKECIGKSDCLARIGGDEFVLFLPNRNREQASKKADQMLACLNAPFLFNDYEMVITPSIGISQYPQDGEDIGTLMKKANLAMHQAKRMGKNNFQFYRNQSIELTNERFEMEIDLRKALEREEFVLYYQPKVEIQSGKITGMEALIRWQHPDKGLISPAQFIPLAEETGMIVPIGEWVLREACGQLKALQETDFPQTVVSVNLSVRQFFQPNLIGMVSQVLDETGLSPEYLEFEITETMMIDTQHALMIVSELKKLGVRISLDDFGTGYSSLHYLKKFPIDILKIDQSFIRDCVSDENDATIVKTIIAMSHQLKLEVIAEGVETKEQLIFLQQNYCNKVQGYLFSKPLPIEEIKRKYEEIGQIVNQLGVPQEFREQLAAGIAHEIRDPSTDQKKSEKQVLESETRYRKLVEQSPEGIVVHQNGIIVFTNQAAKRLVKEDQLIGNSIYQFIHPDFHELSKQRVSEVHIGEQLTLVETKLIQNGGTHIDVEFGGMSIIYDGNPSIMVLISDITERKSAEQALIESEERYKRLVKLTPEPILVHRDGLIRFANPAFTKLVGAANHMELIGKSVIDFAPPDYVDMVENRINQLRMVGTYVAPAEEKVICLDGTIIDVEVTGITLAHGEQTEVLMMIHDITSRKRAEEDLIASEEKYRLITDYSQDMIKLVDQDGMILYASPSHNLNLGFNADEYVGKHVKDGIHPDDLNIFQECIHQSIKEHQSFTIEIRRQHNNGQWIWIESNGTLVLNEKGNLQHIVFTCRNIMERKQYKEKLEYLAFHDTLTGLPNRRSFKLSLEQSVKEAERYQRIAAIMFMDLDKFKWINDTLGHDVGDELLIQFAHRIKKCLRDSDIIARLGGDEFIILLPEIKSETDAIITVDRIIAVLQEPWKIGEHSFQTTSSIGISLYPRDGENPKTLIKNADTALYKAKEEGRNNYHFFVNV